VYRAGANARAVPADLHRGAPAVSRVVAEVRVRLRRHRDAHVHATAIQDRHPGVYPQATAVARRGQRLHVGEAAVLRAVRGRSAAAERRVPRDRENRVREVESGRRRVAARIDVQRDVPSPDAVPGRVAFVKLCIRGAGRVGQHSHDSSRSSRTPSKSAPVGWSDCARDTNHRTSRTAATTERVSNRRPS